MTENNDIWKTLNYKDMDTCVAACILEVTNARMEKTGCSRKEALEWAENFVKPRLVEKMARDLSKSNRKQPQRKRQPIEEQFNEMVRAHKHWLSK